MTSLADTRQASDAPSTAAAADAMPRVGFQREVVCLLGLPFDVIDVAGAVDHVRRAAAEGARCFVSTPNLNFAMAARGDAAFRDSVLHSDLNLADGMPLVWIARLLRLPIRERVSGAGLFERLVAHPAPPVRVYFFGGPPGAAQAASDRVNAQASGVRCVGFDSVGFGSLDDISTDEHLARINRSGAQFVIVALGAQKGQAWIERNRPHLTAPLISHLGAVVNFAAGSLERAPERAQAWGLEWLWRIKEQPELWRRYWRDGWQFMFLLATRVLPYAALIRWRAPAVPGADGVAVSVVESPQGLTVTLKGSDWTRSTLQGLRDLLTQLSATDVQRLCIVLEGVRWVDSAFVGLMLLARGRFGGTGRFVLQGASPRVARIFRFNGAEFLLDSPSTPAL